MEIPLYTNDIPNEIPGPDEEVTTVQGGKERISNIRKPTLTVYLPPKDKANGTAVIICPGGGYAIVAASHEGYDVAKKFNEQGIAAFVLKYRLPNVKTSTKPEIAPLQDAQQALLLVRERANEWNIDPAKVGIMGFSAGGHVASTAGTHFQQSYIENTKNTNLRPDFMLLIYPVISGNADIAHQGSFVNLLGKDASPEKIKKYSNEYQVTLQTPPTFLVHASDDNGVKSENSIVFYQALLRNNVPAEMHLYQNGGHGFGLINNTTKDIWFERCLNWLSSNDFVPETFTSQK
ncbi:alpha/beta hydrolase [Pontibacter silvestris]|uniref:Alpha/beta hydrolase n=1 Tax=Pontibacter silvestris TaxID=2305183 RepID=A0ABW4WY01_9BACT|nr:alpha/beta hydrolase [Pontibacter silvestris]MCC9135284.1 alpha/beta hydrolase [Pontibacter silvestris]